MSRDTYSLLILDGELPPLTFVADIARQAQYVICTDGVAEHLKFLEPSIDAIVGDMDSLQETEFFLGLGVPILRDPSQYSNDFEKGLRVLIERGTHHVIVLGLSGKRIDHTATNLSVMQRFTPSFESLVFADQYGVSYFVLGPVTRHKIEARKEGLVSLTPIPAAYGVVTEDLMYPVRNETMIFGEREGLSNIVTSDGGAYLSLEGGAMLVSIVTSPGWVR